MRYLTAVVALAACAAVTHADTRNSWSWGADGHEEAHDSAHSSISSAVAIAPSSGSPRTVSFTTNGDHQFVDPGVSVISTAKQSQSVIPPPIAIAGSAGSVSVAPQVTGDHLKGETPTGRVDGAAAGDLTEGRFFGIKSKLCDVGIGFDCKKGYHKGDHISPYDINYVQPVQVVPVGGPIASVPINKGYHHKAKGHYSPPSTGYGAPHPPSLGYGAPHPPSTGYGAPPVPPPSPVELRRSPCLPPSPVSYGAPPAPTYTPPKASYSAPTAHDQTVVHHVHTHHHVYTGGSGGGYAKDSYSGGFLDRSSSSSSSSVNKIGSALPVIPLGPSSSSSAFSSTDFQRLYREDCQCVDRIYCRDHDIVGRTSRNFGSLLDARTRNTDILSTADDESDKQAAASEKQEVVVEKEDKTETAARTKRDTMRFVNDRFGSSTRTQRQSSLSYTPGVNGCAVGHVCCRNPSFRQSRQVSSCGRRSSFGLLGRVKNTHFEQGDTEFGEYPWQAAILRRDAGDNVYVCGAVLIDHRHLLTAAHCISGLSPAELKVRLGEWDVGRDTEFYRHVDIDVLGIYPHPEFYSGNLHNDIAVLKLISPVDLVTNPHISPVCLPDRFTKFTGSQCQAAGWGKNAFGDLGNFQNLLKDVSLPMVDQRLCQNALRQTRLGPNFSLHESMICAGGEAGSDTCEGDGGSPLVCQDRDGTFRLAGLVSWGIGCGQQGVPGVYANVPLFIDWISSITRS
ncbi:LOW QUALITY PROTEIN: uncharacterized protein LOC125044534 [Penaeus chinensis]|uniref:LOW QUALITY PROTEIN: uncharacterized protein LOC125044534 n=1 Tax=Penaeus chinensis TaxID=139456 RepID=UPI001FB7CF49|nr:LOW QUALITY PROTEIN: uncharacterized protein LOC125044534 [Penaeus chinensis]